MNNTPRQRGFSLVELMVALTIGSFLIIGAVTVYVQSRNSYTVNETVARLQENDVLHLLMRAQDADRVERVLAHAPTKED